MTIPILQMHKKQDIYGNKKTIIYYKRGNVYLDDASLTNIELECIHRHDYDRTSILSPPNTYDKEKWTRPFVCQRGFFLTKFSLQVQAYKVR